MLPCGGHLHVQNRKTAEVLDRDGARTLGDHGLRDRRRLRDSHRRLDGRGLRLVTGLPIVQCAQPGWVGLQCAGERMASWLARAIEVENVSVRREGAILYLPAGPTFQLDKEIKNVITVVAKTHHYWTEHRYEMSMLT